MSNRQHAILEGLSRVRVNEASNKYLNVSDIRNSPKVRDFFVSSLLIDDFYDFLNTWDKMGEKEHKANFNNLEYKPKRFSVGKNYIKVIGDGFVSAFVDRFGNVYKPASWDAPAKGVRYYLQDYDDIKFDNYGSFLYGNRNLTPKTKEDYV